MIDDTTRLRMQQNWKDPEIRRRRIKAMKVGMRAAWADPEKKKRRMELNKGKLGPRGGQLTDAEVATIRALVRTKLEAGGVLCTVCREVAAEIGKPKSYMSVYRIIRGTYRKEVKR